MGPNFTKAYEITPTKKIFFFFIILISYLDPIISFVPQGSLPDPTQLKSLIPPHQHTHIFIL